MIKPIDIRYATEEDYKKRQNSFIGPVYRIEKETKKAQEETKKQTGSNRKS